MTIHTSLPQCSLMSPSVLMIHDCSHQPSQCSLMSPSVLMIHDCSHQPSQCSLMSPSVLMIHDCSHQPSQCSLVSPSVLLMIHDYSHQPSQCSLMSPSVLMIHDYSHQPSPVLSWHKPCPELRQPTVPTSHSPFIFLNVSLSSLKIITKTDVVNFSMIQLCIVHLQEWRKSQWSLLCGQSPALVSCG